MAVRNSVFTRICALVPERLTEGAARWQYVACTFAATRVILNMHTDPLASASMNGRRRRRRVIRESTTRVRGGKDGESGWQGKLGENEVGFALTTVMRGPEETSMCVDVVGRGRWDERDRRGAEG